MTKWERHWSLRFWVGLKKKKKGINLPKRMEEVARLMLEFHLSLESIWLAIDFLSFVFNFEQFKLHLLAITICLQSKIRNHRETNPSYPNRIRKFTEWINQIKYQNWLEQHQYRDRNDQTFKQFENAANQIFPFFSSSSSSVYLLLSSFLSNSILLFLTAVCIETFPILVGIHFQAETIPVVCFCCIRFLRFWTNCDFSLYSLHCICCCYFLECPVAAITAAK